MTKQPPSPSLPPAHKRRKRRATRGLVAGYLHDLSARHGKARREVASAR